VTGEDVTNRSFPAISKVPAFTVVPPVKVFTPPSTNVPAPSFVKVTADAPSEITPAKFPLLTVNAEPFINTEPPPFKPKNSTDPAASVTAPFAVKTVATGSEAPAATFNAAPTPTVNVSDNKLAEPLKANVPALTTVEPE
jgi:hypothetical protein